MRNSRLAFMVALTASLTIAHAGAAFAGGDGEADIRGIVWKWQRTLYNDDTRVVPSDPSRYTVLLEPDGSLHVKVDCNAGGGRYTLEESRIALEVTHTTMAACPPQSLEAAFMKGLAAATIVLVKDGELYFDLKYDSGTMKFSK